MTQLSCGTRRARKQYGCDLGCSEWIEPGEVHHVQANAVDGTVQTFRAHLHCYALAEHELHGRSDRGWMAREYLGEVGDLELSEWSRADVEAACDRQRWSSEHPARERARALWQRFQATGAPRVYRNWGGEWRPGTALEVRR